MGGLFSCCQPSDDEHESGQRSESYDRERLRELQLQAAERRMKENEHRGVKDVESVKRQQAKKEQMEKMEQNQSRSQEGNLRWQVS